jgi:hypothetical protein
MRLYCDCTPTTKKVSDCIPTVIMPGLYSDCNCPILNTVGILYQNSIVVTFSLAILLPLLRLSPRRRVLSSKILLVTCPNLLLRSRVPIFWASSLPSSVLSTVTLVLLRSLHPVSTYLWHLLSPSSMGFCCSRIGRGGVTIGFPAQHQACRCQTNRVQKTVK